MFKEQQPALMRRCIEAVLEDNQEQILELSQVYPSGISLARNVRKLNELSGASKHRAILEWLQLDDLFSYQETVEADNTLIPVSEGGEVREYRQFPLTYQGEVVGSILFYDSVLGIGGPVDVKVVFSPKCQNLQALSHLGVFDHKDIMVELVQQFKDILQKLPVEDITLTAYGKQQAGYWAQGFLLYLMEACKLSEEYEERSDLDEINALNLVLLESPGVSKAWYDEGLRLAKELCFLGLKFESTVANTDKQTPHIEEHGYLLSDPTIAKVAVSLLSPQKERMLAKIDNYLNTVLLKFEELIIAFESTKAKLAMLPEELAQEMKGPEQELKILKVSLQAKKKQLSELVNLSLRTSRTWYDSVFEFLAITESREKQQDRLLSEIKVINKKLKQLEELSHDLEEISQFVLETVAEKRDSIQAHLAEIDEWELMFHESFDNYLDWSLETVLKELPLEGAPTIQGDVSQEYLNFYFNDKGLEDAPEQIAMRAHYLKEHHLAKEHLHEIPFRVYELCSRIKIFETCLEKMQQLATSGYPDVHFSDDLVPFYNGHGLGEPDNLPLGMQGMAHEVVVAEDHHDLYPPNQPEQFLPGFESVSNQKNAEEKLFEQDVLDEETSVDCDTYPEPKKSSIYRALEERLSEYSREVDKTFKAFTNLEYLCHELIRHPVKDGDVIPVLQENGRIEDYEVLNLYRGKYWNVISLEPVNAPKGNTLDLPIIFVPIDKIRETFSHARIGKCFSSEQKMLMKAINKAVREISIPSGKRVVLKVHAYGALSAYAQCTIWGIVRALTQNSVNGGFFDTLGLPANMLNALKSYMPNSIIADLNIHNIAGVDLLVKCPASVSSDVKMQANVCLSWLKRLFGRRIKFKSLYQVVKASQYFDHGKSFVFANDISQELMDVKALLFKEYSLRQSYYADHDFQFILGDAFKKSLDERATYLNNHTPDGMEYLKKVFEEKLFDFDAPDSSMRHFI